MAATVRVAQVLGTVANVTNTTHASSDASGGSLARVRVAEVSADSGQTTAQVRVADVTASNGGSSGAIARIRVSDVRAFAVQDIFQWDGDTWIEVSPTGAIQSTTAAKSAVTATTTVTGASTPSKAVARSAVTGVVSFTATVSVPVGVTVTDSGVKNPVAGDQSATVSIATTVNVNVTGSPSVGPPGAGSLTVTPDPLNSPPRILLSLVGALGPNVTILRVDALGTTTPVRLANPGTLTGGGWVGYDYEAPFNTTVRYQATATRVITSDPVTLNVYQPWLIHPGIPNLSQPLEISNLGDETKDATQSVQYAIGRRNPIVQTDGVRHAPVFDMTVTTSSNDQRAALDTLLADDTVLLLQIAYPDIGDSDYSWVAVGNVVKGRPSPLYAEPTRQWTLPCTVTDAPSGLLQAQRTWRDVLAEFSSWQDVLDTYATWRDVITDTRITD